MFWDDVAGVYDLFVNVYNKYPLRDSEIPIVLEDFLLKNFNIQEFVFSSLT